jgi:PKD repeat protein
MRFRLGSALLLTALVMIGAVAPVSAHVLRSDKGITAEMHIPPDDQVTATKPTTIEFNFENEPSSFSLIECGCSLRITGATDVSLQSSLQLDRSAVDQLTTQVTFPKPGTYTVQLTGATTSSSNEGQFSVSYNVVAKPAAVTTSRTVRNISIALVDICTLAIVGVTIFYYFRPKRKIRPESES